MSVLGFVTPAALIGLQSVTVAPQRGVYAQKGQAQFSPLVAQAIVEEDSSDQLEIVEHPVEQGAKISDHAFKVPADVAVHYLWSNSPSSAGAFNSISAALLGSANLPQSLLSGNAQTQARAIYAQLLKLQTDRTLFTLYTGKRTYLNMLIRSLRVRTDARSENMLELRMECRQIIFATTSVAVLGSAPAAQQILPESTQSPIDNGIQSLAEAPQITATMNNLAAPVSATIDTMTTALGSATSSLQSVAQSAVETLNVTAATALDKLPGVMDTFSSMLQSSADSLTGAMAGAAGQLPGIMNDAVSNLREALTKIGTPFEIPLTPDPQFFTIPLGIAR